MWLSSRTPLPPSRSRASAMTWRALRVLLSLARPAMVSVSRPLVFEAGELHAVQLHAGDLGQHLDQAVLDDLERAQGPAELPALLGVGQGGVVGGDGVAERGPGAGGAGGHEHPAGVGEPLGPRKPGLVGQAGPFEGDVRLPDGPGRALALHGGGGEAGGVLLHQESLDLAVLVGAGPHHDDVGDRPVADPPLGPVEHPVAARPGGPWSRAIPSPTRASARSGRRRRWRRGGPGPAASAAFGRPIRAGRWTSWPVRTGRRGRCRGFRLPGAAPC